MSSYGDHSDFGSSIEYDNVLAFFDNDEKALHEFNVGTIASSSTLHTDDFDAGIIPFQQQQHQNISAHVPNQYGYSDASTGSSSGQYVQKIPKFNDHTNFLLNQLNHVNQRFHPYSNDYTNNPSMYRVQRQYPTTNPMVQQWHAQLSGPPQMSDTMRARNGINQASMGQYSAQLSTTHLNNFAPASTRAPTQLSEAIIESHLRRGPQELMGEYPAQLPITHLNGFVPPPTKTRPQVKQSIVGNLPRRRPQEKNDLIPASVQASCQDPEAKSKLRSRPKKQNSAPSNDVTATPLDSDLLTAEEFTALRNDGLRMKCQMIISHSTFSDQSTPATYCGIFFKDPEEASRHLIEAHGIHTKKNKAVKATYCTWDGCPGAKLDVNTAIKCMHRHILENHLQVVHRCPVRTCKYKNRRSYEVTKHLKKHQKIGPIQPGFMYAIFGEL